MSDTTPAAFSIVPWVRRGLASLISAQPTTNFASLPVTVNVNGAAVNVPAIRLIGPGQITALDARAVVRTEPQDGANTFEPSYLAFVELALPDLPWMFSPSPVVNARLTPWICLIVAPDVPGVTLQPHSGGINVLTIDSPLDPKSELPDLTTIDCFAHAQVAGPNVSGAALNAALDGDPSQTIARLIAPRKLDPGQSYFACIVPSYRAGVNAALGLPVDDHDLAPAWDATVSAPFTLPVYYSFRFHTGPGGDFASLAQQIAPPKTKLEAGTRALDVSQPGFGVAGVAGVTLGLEGALQSVGNQSTAWPAGAQETYEAQLRAALVPPAAPDPVVAPPTYGSTHSGAALPADNAAPVWLGELNLDPRTRSAAGAGSQVVQQDQDALVASVWDQFGEIRKANQMLRQAQLARQVSASMNQRHLGTISGDGEYLQITAPIHARIRLTLNGATATLRGHVQTSRLPSGSLSPAMRRMTRPGAIIGRQLTAGAAKIVDRLNLPSSQSGALQVAGPAQPPRGMVTFDDVVPAIQVKSMTAAALSAAPGWKIVAEVSHAPDLTGTLQVDPAKLSGSEPPAKLSVTEPPAKASDSALSAKVSGSEAADEASKPAQPPAVAKILPLVDWASNPNLPDLLKGPHPNLPTILVFPSDQASLNTVVANFRTAAESVNTYLNTAPPAPADPSPLGGQPLLAPARTQLASLLNPESTIPARLKVRIGLTAGTDPLQPVRTGPSFPQPMYAALAQLSPDWMLPGISDVPMDCATLLADNPKFVEAYMVGLNDELARELLWREFPGDRRVTYFQSFWSRGAADIAPIASFDPSAHLGSHVVDSSSGTRFVLLIRANLFLRYPNAVVSAIQAQWAGNVRRLTDTRLYPIFRGNIGTDVTFFGFDIADPLGSNDPTAAKPGWYFAIEEHPTETRFGLEPEKSSTANPVWNDLSWEDVSLHGSFLDPATPPATPVREGVTWSENAAALAFILIRRPVRVAMHAQALLGGGS
jgi:hypothetical protein